MQTVYIVAWELLDEECSALTVVSIHDDNAYTFGRIEEHNVVIACPRDIAASHLQLQSRRIRYVPSLFDLA
jgi:hypothetical protein